MSTEKKTFELVAPLDTATEKKFQAHRKNLDLYFAGLNRSKADMLGYAFLIGNELNVAKDILPHGEFGKFVTETYALPETTQRRWRELAPSVIERVKQLKTEGKSATVAVLKSPTVNLIGKKKFSEKERQTILQIIPEIMERKGMVQFIEDVKLMREPTHQTHTKPRELTPEERSQAEIDQAEAIVSALISDIDLITLGEGDDLLALCSPKTRKTLLDSAVTLNNKLRELDKSK